MLPPYKIYSNFTVKYIVYFTDLVSLFCPPSVPCEVCHVRSCSVHHLAAWLSSHMLGRVSRTGTGQRILLCAWQPSPTLWNHFTRGEKCHHILKVSVFYPSICAFFFPFFPIGSFCLKLLMRFCMLSASWSLGYTHIPWVSSHSMYLCSAYLSAKISILASPNIS